MVGVAVLVFAETVLAYGVWVKAKACLCVSAVLMCGGLITQWVLPRGAPECGCYGALGDGWSNWAINGANVIALAVLIACGQCDQVRMRRCWFWVALLAGGLLSAMSIAVRRANEDLAPARPLVAMQGEVGCGLCIEMYECLADASDGDVAWIGDGPLRVWVMCGGSLWLLV
jgi:hypothetical protein